MLNVVACSDDDSGAAPNEIVETLSFTSDYDIFSSSDIGVPGSSSVKMSGEESSSSIESGARSSSGVDKVPESSSAEKKAEASSSSVAFVSPAYVLKDEMTDERDGKTYKTVTIGTQIWMAENLDYSYNKGTANSFCYRDDPDYCDLYGRLYTWSAAMDSAASFSDGGAGCGGGKLCTSKETVRGICPGGWHLPSIDEWNTLVAAVGGSDSAAIRLKSTTGWNSKCNGIDSYGFSAFPAGYRYLEGDFRSESGFAFFWVNEDFNKKYARYVTVSLSDEVLVLDSAYKFYAFSVRCLKDTGAIFVPESSSGRDLADGSSSSAYESANFMTDDRDGKTYRTVTIGTQTWMAENLNFAYNEPTEDLDSSSFCYDDTTGNCLKFGRYYMWSAAMDSAGVFSDGGKGCGYGDTCNADGTVRGVCPSGWHLPSMDEWRELIFTAGGDSLVGDVLKSKIGWYRDGNGIDFYGFSILPAGFGFDKAGFSDAFYASFWSSTENDDETADALYFSYDSYGVDVDDSDKDTAYSIRCVKNKN